MTDLLALSARDLLARYAAKTLSPVELVETVLTRLEAVEPDVNAFTFVDIEGARAAARASEARWQAGAPIGPADGLVATIKDNILSEGLPTRRGTRTSPDTSAAFDAPATARLREAGAIILGKTALPEIGWKGLGDSPLHGATRNPWHTGRTSGGSSAGAAVAAALGLGSFHLGTDGARLDPHPGGVLWRVRVQADVWPRAGLSALDHGRARASGAADPDRRGRGAHAVADRPSGRARQHCLDNALSRLHAGARPRHRRSAHRLCADAVRRVGRAGGGRVRGAGCAPLRDAGRACRGGRSRLSRPPCDDRRAVVDRRGDGDEGRRPRSRGAARSGPARGGPQGPRAERHRLPRRVSRARRPFADEWRHSIRATTCC